MVGHSRVYMPGEVIFREGDENDAVYIIELGSVAVIKAEPDGKSVILARLAAPQIVGEMGVLNGAPRNATTQAMERSQLKVIPQTDFTTWIRRDPEAALRVMRTLALRLSEAGSPLPSLSQSVVPQG